jgi:hypothetical protein
VHGEQEGRFFHGYCGGYCYLPLYIFTGEHLLCGRLRSSNVDASAGALEEVQRIAKQLRRVWPEVEIVLRADSGFCRNAIMTWCEQNRVGYVFGLAKNERLLATTGQSFCFFRSGLTASSPHGAGGERAASRPETHSVLQRAATNPGV